jgi:hypothetical protein
MASAALSRRVEKVVAYPPLCDMDDRQRREFHEACLTPTASSTCRGKWQAAIVSAEQNRPKLRVVRADSWPEQYRRGGRHGPAWLLS